MTSHGIRDVNTLDILRATMLGAYVSAFVTPCLLCGTISRFVRDGTEHLGVFYIAPGMRRMKLSWRELGLPPRRRRRRQRRSK